MNQGPVIEPYTIEPYQEPVQFERTTTYDFGEEPKPRRKIPIWLMILGAVVVFILLVLLLSLLSGGRNTPNQGGNQPGGNTNRNVTLQFWGAYMAPEVIQPLLDEYNQINPNVKIEYADRMKYSGFEESQRAYRTDLFRVLSGDVIDIPDIFMVHNTWAHDFENVVTPSLTYDLGTFENTFYPAAVQDFTNNQIVYGVPLWIDTLAILYNKDMINEVQLNTPPTNWVPFISAAQNLTKKSNNRITRSGFASGTSTNTSFFFELLSILMMQNGITFPTSQEAEFRLATSNGVESVNFFKQFIQGNNNTWDSSLENDAAAFLNENAAMIVTTAWRYRDILKFNEQGEKGISMGISPLPQIEGTEAVNWADYWGVMASNSRPYGFESWQFIQWLLEPAQQEKLHQNIAQNSGYFGHIYPRKDMASQLENNEFLSTFVNSAGQAKTWFMAKGPEIRSIFRRIVSDNSMNASRLSTYQNELEELKIFKGTLRNLN